jgi:hypothetical protein
MFPDELQKSWTRTIAFLRDARAHISEAGESICADEIAEFESYLDHNELELALDMLDEVVQESFSETPQIVELMAKAALSMGLADRVRKYDEHLSEWQGGEYHTKMVHQQNLWEACGSGRFPSV